LDQFNDGDPRGLTVHITSADRDVSFDLNGGNRIPRAAERMARSVDELRAAGIGVSKVLLVHDGSLVSHDVFEWLLTMLLPEVELNFAIAAPIDLPQANARETIVRDKQQAEQLGRKNQAAGRRATKRNRHCSPCGRRRLRFDRTTGGWRISNIFCDRAR